MPFLSRYLIPNLSLTQNVLSTPNDVRAISTRTPSDAPSTGATHWLRNLVALVFLFFVAWNVVHAMYSDEPWTLLGNLPEHLQAQLDYAAHPPPV
ncbi:hypothetical protein AAVH_15367 [Aphelenchoides avenae]|nr:hypothetical protein AAVH_15367 [Aphelenchus avenae]